jgi:hypothetical protein
MDNLSAHRGERGCRLIEVRSCKLLYLRPYSPDLNPIEEAFSKIKARLRRAGALAMFLEALDAALSAVNAPDARGLFDHCGYRAAVVPTVNSLRHQMPFRAARACEPEPHLSSTRALRA